MINNMKEVCIHIIDSYTDRLITKEFATHVPRVFDDIRVGGEGNERYYTVEAVVWVYDEPESPYERVNIGVTEYE